MAEYSYPELGGKIVLDTSELGKSIKYLQNSIATIRQESALTINTIEGGEKSVKGLTQKLKDLNAVQQKQGTIVAKYTDDLKALIAKEGESSSKVAAKRKALSDAKVSYSNTQKAIDDYKKALEKAQEKEKYGIKSLDELGDKVGKFSPKLGTIISKFADWRVVAGSVATALGVAMVKAVNQGIQAFAEYETAFTNVRKTVDGTEADFETLNAEIQHMAQTMPKTAAEIAEVAALGGQLGVAVDSLGEFTETMIKLGDSTTLTADQAGEMIAQIAAITGMTTSDYERFGSAVVELGNNFATTESKMLETTQRISRFSTAVGLNAQEVLALSTTLAALGLESDASGTAMQKIFSQIQLAIETSNEELTGFAETAGLSVDEFSALWKSSSMAGFQAFIQGMADLDDAGQSTVVTLDKLGISEVRLTSVLQALTSNTGMLEKAINMTNDAWTENTALTSEAEKKYSTYANQVQMTKNTWELVSQAIGEMFMPAAKAANSISGDLASAILGIVDPSKKAETAISDVRDAMDEYSTKADSAKKKNEELSESFTKVTSATLVANLTSVAEAYEDVSKSIDKAQRKIKALTSQKPEVGDESIGTALMFAATTVKDGITSIDDALALADNIAFEKLSDTATADDVEYLITTAAQYREATGQIAAAIEEQNAAITAGREKQLLLAQNYAKAVEEGLLSISLVEIMSPELAQGIKDYQATIMREEAEAAEAAERLADADAQAVKAREQFYAQAQTVADKTLERLKGEAEGYALIAEQISFYEEKIKELKQTSETQTAGTEAYEETRRTIEGLSTAAANLKAQLAALSPEYDTLADYIKAYGTETEQAHAELTALRREKSNLEQLQAMTVKGSTAWEDYARKIELVNRGVADQETKIGDLKKAYAEDFAAEYGTSVASVSKLIQAADEESVKVMQAFMSRFNAGTITEEDEQKLTSGLETLRLFKAEFESVKAKLQDEFDVDSYINTYGTEAQKTEYKIHTLKESIQALKDDLAAADNEDYKVKVQIAIALEERALEEAQTEYAEMRGQQAGKKWWEAFADELSGGGEAYQNSGLKQFLTSFADSLSSLGGYVGDISDSVIDNLMMHWDTEVSELDAKLNRLSSDAETKTAAVDNELEAKQRELDERRDAGKLTEIAYYKATTKAANDAAAAKAKIADETAAKEQQLLKDKDALAKKQFAAEKANNIAQATINGVVAASKAWAELGPIAGPIMALTIAGLTAWQVAEISRQQYVPALASGGITTGPTYALIGDNKSGQEAVIPLEDSTMRLLAGKIVDAMQRGNVYNNYSSDNDARSYTINQTITPAKGLTAREIYLQSRKALRDAKHY